MLEVRPIRAFTDNYIWALTDDAGRCCVVDPGDAAPVKAWLAENDRQLASILVTHHHFDHTGGIPALLETGPVPVYGPDNPRIKGISHPLRDGERFTLEPFGVSLEVLAIPGHTLDHIAFFGEPGLFCGDTLFSCGCGRLFEGTPAQMHASLSRLAELPGDTPMYCGHEYTLANMAFALSVDPHNMALQAARAEAQALRDEDAPTLPSTLARERTTNPFLRCHDPDVIAGVQAQADVDGSDVVAVFAALRQLKDNY